MATAGRVLFIVSLILAVLRIGKTVEVPDKTEYPVEELQGRQFQSFDSYWYNDVYYWWPWFSDLATVVMIKLKIAIAFAAMYAFGDGYYWSKAKSEEPPVGSWDGTASWSYGHHHHPSYLFGSWGRRKRDLNAKGREDKRKFVEFVFDALEVYDEDCRKRVVCELEFELQRNSKAKNLFRKYKFGMFEKYQGAAPKSREDCERMYGRCRMPLQEDEVQFSSSGEEAAIEEMKNKPEKSEKS
ncbi:uncharacterized protein LOC128736726 [Sabethes cyaneus]|uniref:uncharacterized protein LOC128736726 n=1 Tax=Sabethes cyaneus TaxID=53552 RepID=UPI00237E8A30|nr:uncharacterized protein LOC128736726 [Sabethes cyaneus]